MLISIKDSGDGFDILKVLKNRSNVASGSQKLSGRGVELVEQLCDTLEYHDNGTLVTASYIWNN